jgi:transposase
LLADGQRANPPPAPSKRRGRASRSPAANLVARLDTYRGEVLRSLDDARAVRQPKRTRPADGEVAAEDLRVLAHAGRSTGVPDVRSYVATARKQGMNPLAMLRQLFEGHPWLPAPTGT